MEQYQIEIPKFTHNELDDLDWELHEILDAIEQQIQGRNKTLDYMIANDEFPTANTTYACAMLVMNGWTKSDIHKVKFFFDSKGYLWLWIKLRTEGGRLPNSKDYTLRWIHGTTPAGAFGITRNAYKSLTNPILPQMGSLLSKKQQILPGFFALGFEPCGHADGDYQLMKHTIDVFGSHKKNQIGIGFTGTNTGEKKGGKQGAWQCQHELHENPSYSMATYGGRVYCFKCSHARMDGLFVNTATVPLGNYNPESPFKLNNL